MALNKSETPEQKETRAKREKARRQKTTANRKKAILLALEIDKLRRARLGVPIEKWDDALMRASRLLKQLGDHRR